MITTPTESSAASRGSDEPRRTQIHTMPEKFYLQDRGGGSGKNRLLVVMLIVLGVVVVAGGAFVVMQKLGQPEETANGNANVVTNGATNVQPNTNAANVNSRINTNTLTNTLTNRNSNANGNVNVGNINLFPGNRNTNTGVNVNALPSSQDTDADGLTDIEEALYGTSISVADTDGDAYADGQEVPNGYDPLGSGKLENSTKVQTHVNNQEGYYLLYPAAWAVADDPQNTRGKIFTASGEFVSVSVQENPARLSARDWYLTKSPGISSASIVSVTNWDKTLSGVESIDGSTVYYTSGDTAYVISYNTNILSQANYKTTFKMMYKSFKLTSGSANTNQTGNVNTNANANSNRNSFVHTYVYRDAHCYAVPDSHADGDSV